MCIKTTLELLQVNLAGPSTCLEVLRVKVGGFVIFNDCNPLHHNTCKRIGEIKDLWAKLYICLMQSLQLASSGSKLVFEKCKGPLLF